MTIPASLPSAGSPEERAVTAHSTAVLLPSHLADAMADIAAYLADFDGVTLSPTAAAALDLTRFHLAQAHAHAQALSVAHLAG